MSLLSHAQQMAFYSERVVVWAYALMVSAQNLVAPDVAVCSYYGEPFHGRLTAAGNVYDMYGMSCAHRDLPLGTVVLFVNWENLRFALLRVEDRGPYVDGRDFDLSLGAADYLADGDLDSGLYYLSYRPLWRNTEGLCYNLQDRREDGQG